MERLSRNTANWDFGAFIGLVKLNIRSIANSAADRLFDYGYGTETSQPIHSPQLRVSQNLRYGTSYIPTRWWVLRGIVRNLSTYPPEYRLVDFGSGKGWVPLMAACAKQPFGKSIGVKYVDLHETALRNASRFLGTKVEFYCTDAAQFSIPHEPCVPYFFNPFDTPVLNCVLERIGLPACLFRRGGLVAGRWLQHCQLTLGTWRVCTSLNAAQKERGARFVGGRVAPTGIRRRALYAQPLRYA